MEERGKRKNYNFLLIILRLHEVCLSFSFAIISAFIRNVIALLDNGKGHKSASSLIPQEKDSPISRSNLKVMVLIMIIKLLDDSSV